MLNRLIAKGASGYMRKQVSQCQKRLPVEGCWGGGEEGGRARDIALGKAIGTRIGWLYGFYYL